MPAKCNLTLTCFDGLSGEKGPDFCRAWRWQATSETQTLKEIPGFSVTTGPEEVRSPRVASLQEMGSLFPSVTLRGGTGHELAKDRQTKLLQFFINSLSFASKDSSPRGQMTGTVVPFS